MTADHGFPLPVFEAGRCQLCGGLVELHPGEGRRRRGVCGHYVLLHPRRITPAPPRCRRCGEDDPRQFYPSQRMSGKLCKVCQRAYMREYSRRAVAANTPVAT